MSQILYVVSLFSLVCIDYTLSGPALIGTLPASSFYAPKSYDNVVCQPVEAKYTRDDSRAWCAATTPYTADDLNPGVDYLQIDLTEIKLIESVSTKGRLSGIDMITCSQRVTSYDLKYSSDGITFISYESNPVSGNVNDCDEVINILTNNIYARYLRFYPLTFDAYPSMKVEAYEFIGCDESSEEFHISFLLDESSSIESENDDGSWDLMIDFVKNVIERDINHNSFINIITFSNDHDINTIYSFTDTYSQSKDRTAINTALDNIVYNGGATYTYDGIEAAIDEFTTSSFGENNILFVLTDGEYSDESNDPCDLSSTLSSNNIALIEIAINTDYSMNCADKHFEVESFSEDDFEQIIEEINEITCIECQVYQAVCCADTDTSSASSVFDTNIDDNFYNFYHSQWFMVTFIGVFILGLISCCAIIGFVSFCNYLLIGNQRHYGYNKVVVDEDNK